MLTFEVGVMFLNLKSSKQLFEMWNLKKNLFRVKIGKIFKHCHVCIFFRSGFRILEPVIDANLESPPYSRCRA